MWAIACPPLLSVPPLSFPVISWHVLSYLVMTCLDLFRIIYYCRSLASSLPFVLWLPFCLSASSYWLKVSNFLSAFSSPDSLLSTVLYSSPGSFLPKYPFLFCLNLSLVSCFLSVYSKVLTSYLPADRSLPVCLQLRGRSPLPAGRSLSVCMQPSYFLSACLFNFLCMSTFMFIVHAVCSYRVQRNSLFFNNSFQRTRI